MCGIVAIFGVESAARVASHVLKKLQHRGQEAAGVAAGDRKGRIRIHRGVGLVDEVFRGVKFEQQLPGDYAIGHVQYSTSGQGMHPFVVMDGKNRIAIAMNGNIRNFAELREAFERRGACFQTTNDTEIFLHLMAQERANAGASLPLEDLLIRASAYLHGGYSVVAISHDRVVALTDPHGFRPLVMGRHHGGTVVASETVVLDLLEADEIQTVPRGTVVVMQRHGTLIRPYTSQLPRRSCSFEYIYFSMPDATWHGLEAYGVRERLGVALGRRLKENGIHADAIMPVPDSANAVAISASQASGIPLQLALVRSHYTGRMFITPDQPAREFGVRMKLSVVGSIVQGRDIILVDDSLVRGTTLRKLIHHLRNVGSRKVHVAIGSPPVVHPCSWGIDTPTHEELVASQYTVDEITQLIGADSLTYLTQQELLDALQDPSQAHHCITCFSGNLPVEEQVIPLERLFAPRDGAVLGNALS